MKYIIAHDFGTSAVKSCIYTDSGELFRKQSATYPTYRPHQGFVEQESEDWWDAFCENTLALTKGIPAEDILCVIFDGVTAASVCCDADFRPLHRAILWQDGRAVEEGQEVSSLIKTPEMRAGREFMGPGRTAVQLYWIAKHHPEILRKAHHIILNNANYVCSRLIGKAVTDKEIAGTGGWLLADRSDWDFDFIDLLGIPRDLLPFVYDMTDIVGEITSESAAKSCGLAVGTKVIVGGDDGGTVTLGAGVVHDGDVSLVCGTSGGVGICRHKGFPGTNAAGASMEWMRKNFCAEEERAAAESGRDVFDLICEKAASSPIGSNGVMFLPYLAGERGVRRNPKTRGVWIGFGLENSREDFIRSVIEGTGFNFAALADRYRGMGYEISTVTAVGGMTKNPFIRQVFADMMNAKIVIVENQSWSGPTGCAMYAAVTMGICEDIDAAADLFVKVESVTAPIPENHEIYSRLMPLFEAAYEAQLPLYDELFELRKG